MRRIALAGILAGTALLCGCSTSNFLVYKDAKHFYVSSNSNSLREILCQSGDLAKITKDSALPDNLQKELFDSICMAKKGERVKERVVAVLEGMTKEQRSSFKLAFELNGYQINNIGNC
jgi:hypothetical protein